MKIIIEGHSKAAPPPDCRNGTWEVMYVVHAVFVEQPDVAAWLSQTFGMPVVLANITETFSSVPGGRQVSWTWTPQGAATSDLQSSRPDAAPTSGFLHIRFVWIMHGHLTMFDQTIEYGHSLLDSSAIGHMKPPMLYAEYAEPYAGPGDFHDTESMTGRIYRFNDENCKEPIDPYP